MSARWPRATSGTYRTEDSQRVWTDDYSNVLGAVWRRLRDGSSSAKHVEAK